MQNYVFWWMPKPIINLNRSSKSKKETRSDKYKNVMYDKRVIRGSNYRNSEILSDYNPLEKAVDLRRRNALRKRGRLQRNVLGSPPTVPGRRNEIVQTDKYLEDLLLHPSYHNAVTQTDLFTESPTKLSIDKADAIICTEKIEEKCQCLERTEIDDGFIENFVHLCLEKGVSELSPRNSKDCFPSDFENLSNESNEAAMLLQSQIAQILPEVLEKFDPLMEFDKREQLAKLLCPWLTVQVAQEVGHIVDSRDILTVIIEEIIRQRGELYAKNEEDKCVDKQT